MTWIAVGLVVPWMVIATQSWLLWRLIRAQGRVEINQASLQGQVQDMQRMLSTAVQPSAAPSPLEIGSSAPEFRLLDLSGRERGLDEFLGKPLVVSFFSPTCSFCRDLAPRLGQIPETGPRMLVISRGDTDENLQLARDHGWRCDVLLDSNGRVTQMYRVGGTPTGYLLDHDGRVVSDLAVGADALLALLTPQGNGNDTLTAESLRQKQEAAVERARQAGLTITESRLNRQGLEPGVKAPGFLLPDLDGEQRSLASFLDRRVLLVFSDPDCGPCDALAPELVSLHKRHLSNNLHVVMISRGDREANRKKARKHGFPFPVLLQKRWEVSKDYAMFATPVAYLIDPTGGIAKPVAVGRHAILGLV